MVTPPDFVRFPELRPHFDTVYDLLVGEEGPRAVSPLLDVGASDGAALAATLAGTDLRGVALDLHRPAEWRGPPGFAFVIGDAARLPFGDGAFPVSLNTETLEWLADAPAALREAARVTRERILLAHTDWRSLWFDSDDPDTSREFTRLFAGRPEDAVGANLAPLAESAGLRVQRHLVQTIRGDRLAADTYAGHLLGLLREWLVAQTGAVRARRFDAWRKALEQRAQAGGFAFSLDRHVVLARPG